MRFVLGEVLVIFGIHDGATRIVDSQSFCSTPTVNVVLGVTVDSEMGRLVDKFSSLGIGTGVRELPEATADIKFSKVVVPQSRDLSMPDLYRDWKIYAQRKAWWIGSGCRYRRSSKLGCH